MKKFFVLIPLIALGLVSMAQAPANKTVYDCDGNSKNIYDVLGTGKSIIVAHKGVDCIICKNSAKPLQTWASNNTSQVEVWGAMTYKYNPNTFRPECQVTKDWDSTYAWDDIFAFADSSRSWHNNSTPRYYVYSAIDSSIVFQGSSRTVAQDSALKHSTISTVGLKDLFKQYDIEVLYQQGQLNITNSKLLNSLAIYDLSGRLVLQQSVNSEQAQINTHSLPKGAYVLQLTDRTGLVGSRKLMLY